MPAELRLYDDILRNDAPKVPLPALPRMLFVLHGTLTVDGKAVAAGEAWFGEGAATLAGGEEGASFWRFELTSSRSADARLKANGVLSLLKLYALLDTLPDGDLIMRGDSVGFPPGGCAYLHRHQGPGIRCLLEGGIRIDTNGHSASYGPGGAWFETGPEPVFAQAAADRPSRFIRVMILPRALLGKSSIEYLNPSDKDKPKSQQYRIFVDAPIAFRRPLR